MLKTDKMDKNDSDTYEIPLKGGLVSYNITSINGTEVMHYFKRIFNKQKTFINLPQYGVEQYELEMQNDDFRLFMEQFVSKINSIVNHKKNEFSSLIGGEINGVSIYPVPSSSSFNSEISKRLLFNTISGFKPSILDSKLLVKDFGNIKKDDEFIQKNMDYYNSQYSNNLPNDVTHINSIEKEYNRFKAISKAQSDIKYANQCAELLIQKYYSRKDVNTPKFYSKLNDLYLNYINAVKQIKNDAVYFDTIANKTSNIHFSKVAKELKYSKGPSIEERSGEIYNMLKKNGYLKDMNKPHKQDVFRQVCRWEPVGYEIKNLGNDVRTAFKDYYNVNSDNDFVNKEINKRINDIIIVFDDNISGGATLSDICLKLKSLGFKYIIPITFGKMRQSWNVGTLTINKPEKFNY